MTRTRNTLLMLSMALASTLALPQSIWKWRDANGALQISDRPPPSSIPDKNILARPGSQTVQPTSADASTATASTPADEAGAAASATGHGDPELEARKRKAQAEKAATEAARKQADQQKDAARKADNCRQARNQLALLESGARVARPNDRGEREFMDDAARSAEIERMRQQVTANCTPAN